MTSIPKSAVASTADIRPAVERACRAIAPTWPLDRFIAVNPFWGWVERPMEEAARELSRLSGARLWMPREYYREAWSRRELSKEHLRRALDEQGSAESVESVIEALGRPEEKPVSLPLLSDVLDSRRDLRHEPAWRDTITHQLSQLCAAYFDTAQSDWRPSGELGLFAAWRRAAIADRGLPILMAAPRIAERARALPEDALGAIAHAVESLGVPEERFEELFRVLLLRINGWAAWCAYRKWQARLEGGDDSHIVELLAARLCWECLLDDGVRSAGSIWDRWERSLISIQERGAKKQAAHEPALQRALELAYQTSLAASLAKPPRSEPQAPAVQAVFCIDVRSEVFRRALEAASPRTETRGFAGFFGLPISYTPIGTAASRPQLPGLLAPALSVTETSGSGPADRAIAGMRRSRLARVKHWQPFQRLPGSAFALVEALGIGYLPKIIKRSLGSGHAPESPDRAGLGSVQGLRPRLSIAGGAGSAEQQAQLAKRVLGAMGLTGGFARIVLLTGHGSRSANNPQAAGLDCGACCGQTGEMNARALALLLNDAAVRAALESSGVSIPETTRFLAALHNTTTDEVELFDTDLLPPSHAEDLSELRRALSAAGERARAERAASLGLSELSERPKALAQAVKARAGDWAQTRPEWGLANNAAFIVAPRGRTRALNLEGRSFLHDYDWRSDTGFSVLELIMTAPMVVTHWINMQYYASTVDNLRYGSGNKVLHNVVGGRIGVFEGNGGDLRIGLAKQSLHDGVKWVHTPLRLSVFIEAPREGIEGVIGKHEVVRQLVENNWLFLFRIDPSTSTVEARSAGGWSEWSRAGAGG